jgi:hypothetical protein
LLSMFIATFCNVAFYHEILAALRGQPLGPLVHRKKRCRPIFFFFF